MGGLFSGRLVFGGAYYRRNQLRYILKVIETGKGQGNKKKIKLGSREQKLWGAPKSKFRE